MKKSKLVIEYDYDFELAGVISPVKSYKLAWEINRKLGITLVRQPDLVVGFKNQDDRLFSYFSYETQLNRLKLFKNKPLDYEGGKYFLVAEFPRYDFIILAASDDATFATRVMQAVKEVNDVELVAPIETSSLRSKVNFIF